MLHGEPTTGPDRRPTPEDTLDATADATADAPEVIPLLEPSDGVPKVVDTPEALAAVVRAFAVGRGPVAIDAERASGYRYGQRTYLVQLRREGAGTAVIDPIALPDLAELSAALRGTEWVLHAASQDLPGLAEQGLVPDQVFDTELASRLLGLDRVGLAAVVAEILGLGLAKEHSAVDWSTRPLPADWLRYAALDVEKLVELRDVLAERLRADGKDEWARQEFEAVRTAAPPRPRVEPWRRTSGLHAVRGARGLAVVRALWEAREVDGRSRDISPGRVLPDAALVAAGLALPTSVADLTALRAYSGKATRRRAAFWFEPIRLALELPDADLPSPRGPRSDGPPPPRSWADRDPAAAARLIVARSTVTALAARLNVPVENLLQPDLLRRLAWAPPGVIDTTSVAQFLADGGARPWQVELIAAPLADALVTVQ